MKISIAFKNNQSFLFKKSNPSHIMANALERIKNYIEKEFPNQYQIKILAYSINNEEQTLHFTCRTISKEIENNYHVEEIQQLLTKTNLKKILDMDHTFNIREIAITPAKRLEAIKRIDDTTVAIEPYFADYCARNIAYCKDIIRRDIQNIHIEYEKNELNDAYCTGKFEEKYIKNARSFNWNNNYHRFAMAIIKHETEAFKNKLLSSGIRAVLMKNSEQDITLEVIVSEGVSHSYSIKKSHLLLTSYPESSQSSPLLTTGMYAFKINGKDPNPFDQDTTRLLSSSNFF